jgi:hypothetical protein
MWLVGWLVGWLVVSPKLLQIHSHAIIFASIFNKKALAF